MDKDKKTKKKSRKLFLQEAINKRMKKKKENGKKGKKIKTIILSGFSTGVCAVAAS